MFDGELGLVYYNYRHYNPQDGRWISRDPIGEKGGVHLYGFVKNNNNMFDSIKVGEKFTEYERMVVENKNNHRKYYIYVLQINTFL